MRRAALIVSGVLVLAGPTVLAFFSGGYFAGPRAWAGVGAWAALGLAVLAGARLPHGRAALMTIGGLSLLAAWTLISILWAPIAGSAYAAGQIAVLYVGMLVAATMVLSTSAARIVEPAVAGGALIVIGYGLSERLVPGLLHFARSVNAQGRLEQPLTYWNAMGELAALGLVLCARLAGDRLRSSWLRAVGAAAVVPLGAGLYISFSRGALFACGAGLLTLVVVARQREQLWAALRAVAAAALGAAAVAFLDAFTSLDGSLSTRERDGTIALALLVVLVLAAGLAQHLLGRRERQGELRLAPRAPWVATGVIAAGLALAIVVGAHESNVTSQQLSGGATRLTTLQSNRYAYWAVAFRAFGTEPLHGVGAGGWAVDWLRWRHVNEGAQDAHSLPLQTLAELGAVGIVLLGVFLAGILLAGREAVTRVGPLAAGPVAGVVTYLAHAPLDWDWQMPAVTLAAMLLVGALLALGGPGRPRPAPVAG